MAEEYNGWTNFATWRVNMDIFNEPFCTGFETVRELGEHMSEVAYAVIESQCKPMSSNSGKIALQYALMFLREVDWAQIARAHFVEPKLEPKPYSQRYDYTDLKYGVELFSMPKTPTVFLQGDDASQFLDEVATADQRWKDGEIDVNKNIEIIDNIISNYFSK